MCLLGWRELDTLQCIKMEMSVYIYQLLILYIWIFDIDIQTIQTLKRLSILSRLDIVSAGALAKAGQN